MHLLTGLIREEAMLTQYGPAEAGVPEKRAEVTWWIIAIFLAFMPLFIVMHIWNALIHK